MKRNATILEGRMKFRDVLPKRLRHWLSLRKRELLFLGRRIVLLLLEKRTHHMARQRPLRVLFLVNEPSKWKTQSLYDALKNNPHYEPIVALTRADLDTEIPDEAVEGRFVEASEFFRKHGIEVKRAYDTANAAYIDPMSFHPDVLFYQQPWDINKIQHPSRLGVKVLTCYVPYFVPNYGLISVDVKDDFHVYLWRYYTLNEEWSEEYRNGKDRLRCLPRFVSVGHPMLDVFMKVSSNDVTTSSEGDHLSAPYIIYAPHWSFNHPNNENFENFSTFLKSGKAILSYAQSHPEMNWLFKPHPTLRHALHRSQAMADSAIDSYFAAWERLGTVCYTGDYMPYFKASRAMITDSASFLVEYACTGNPIIHLVSSDRKIEPMRPSRKLFACYYQAHNLDEMYAHFTRILERGEDPRRTERHAAIRNAKLIGVNAAKNILSDLDSALGINS